MNSVSPSDFAGWELTGKIAKWLYDSGMLQPLQLHASCQVPKLHDYADAARVISHFFQFCYNFEQC